MSVGVGWLPATATRSVPARWRPSTGLTHSRAFTDSRFSPGPLRVRTDKATVSISKNPDFHPVTANNATVPIIGSGLTSMAEKRESLSEYAGYACVTRKSNCRKEVPPRGMPQSGFNDYSCVTRKPNQRKEMMFFGEVPIIPVSHVSFIAPRTYGRI
jgi:hypothetical protein